jgi:hypothetical protein
MEKHEKEYTCADLVGYRRNRYVEINVKVCNACRFGRLRTYYMRQQGRESMPRM